MIKEIHIDFNKNTIEFEANQYRKGDKTYPSYKTWVHSVAGDPPTIWDVISCTFGLYKVYNKAIKDHYESFVKNGKY